MLHQEVSFDTNSFFSGGAGMFIQYHDLIKPVKFYVIIRMILTGESFGLPVSIIKDMRNISLVEWYMRRSFINPLQQLDFARKIDPKVLNDLLRNVLLSDHSIYSSAPPLNVVKMLSAYRQQHMQFPVFIYTEEEEPFVLEDCKKVLPGIPVEYLYGDLKKALGHCSQNFTYIFSDIDLTKSAIELLRGTFSHVLVAGDYRYNYTYVGKTRKMKYDLQVLGRENPFIRPGTTMAVDQRELAQAIKNIYT